MNSCDPTHVVAAALLDHQGRVLIAQRPVGRSEAGKWEFPGGKTKPGEERLEALARELHEELGVRVRHESVRPLIRYLWEYEHKVVDLDFWLVSGWSGTATGREGQCLEWLKIEQLMARGLLEADRAAVTALRLGPVCALPPPYVTVDRRRLLEGFSRIAQCPIPFEQGANCRASRGPNLIFRCPGVAPNEVIQAARKLAADIGGGARLILHGEPNSCLGMLTETRSQDHPCDSPFCGIHIPSRYLYKISARPVARDLLLGVSCHQRGELERAFAIGADYAFLGSVKETKSHPGQPGIGWEQFEERIRDLPLPVYAIGGVGPDDLETAWAAGAQGVAGISAFWPK